MTVGSGKECYFRLKLNRGVYVCEYKTPTECHESMKTDDLAAFSMGKVLHINVSLWVENRRVRFLLVWISC